MRTLDGPWTRGQPDAEVDRQLAGRDDHGLGVYTVSERGVVAAKSLRDAGGDLNLPGFDSAVSGWITP